MFQIEHKQDSQDGGTCYFIVSVDDETGIPQGITFHILHNDDDPDGDAKIKINFVATPEACKQLGTAILSWSRMLPGGKMKLQGKWEDSSHAASWANVWFEWDFDGNCTVTANAYDGATQETITETVKYLRAKESTYPDGTKRNDSIAACKWCEKAALQMTGVTPTLAA